MGTILNFDAAGGGLRGPRQASKVLRRRSGVRTSGLRLPMVPGGQRGRCFRQLQRPIDRVGLKVLLRLLHGEQEVVGQQQPPACPALGAARRRRGRRATRELKQVVEALKAAAEGGRR